MTESEIFDYYRTTRTLDEEDKLDYLSMVCDAPDVSVGAMAVAGLTLSLIENGWDKDRMRLLIQSLRPENELIVIKRALVGLLLVMVQHDTVVRTDTDTLEQVQEVLTIDPEVTFNALCDIARTTQVERVVACNKNMTRDLMPFIQNQQQSEIQSVIQKYKGEMMDIARLHLDQNYVFFKELYRLPFFLESAANWLLPWHESSLQNVPEEDRDEFGEMLGKWPLCDSDKYALVSNQMYKMLRSLIQDRLQMESLRDVGNAMEENELFTNLYVQQLYRFFNLSSFTQSHPFESVHHLRDTMVYRLVVVGSEKQAIISELII